MRKLALSLSILSSIFLSLQSCGDKNKKEDPEVLFDEAGMLENISDNIITPAYSKLNEDVSAMNSSIETFTSDVNSTNLTNARNAWKAAVLTWQDASVYQIGPASDIALRDNVNLFPVDTALINNNINTGTYDLASAQNYTAKGFQAIDYLLFGIASTDDEIVTKYGSDNFKNYLNDVSGDIASKVSEVNTDWNTYSTEFKSNTGTDVGSSIGLLTNQLNLYYERFLRDGKLGIPAGARTFSQTPLPEKSECYYYNQNSTELFTQGVSSLKNLYLGKDGLGYDDYLIFNEDESINNSIKSQFETIEGKTANLGSSIADEVTSNQEGMLSIFDDMQLLNNLLKVEMTNSLEVQITYSDTDGD